MAPRLLALVAVLAVAFAARVVGTATLQLADGTVRPVSSDAHYYLRRIVATYNDFPHLPLADPGLGCPDETVPPWPGGLERLIAGVARLALPGQAAAQEVERFAAWSPVVAGVLTAAAAWALATAWLGALAGLLAGLLLGLLPLHVWYTSYSFVDHHMLLGLWLAALIWQVDDVLQTAARRPAHSGRRAWRLGLVLAAGHALMTEAWIAELVLTAAALATVATALPAGEQRRAGLRGLVLAVWLGALLAVPAVMQAPYFQRGLVAPHAPSRFTLWLLGGLALALAAGLAAAGRGAERRARALGVALAAGAGLAVLAAALDPAMPAAFRALAGFGGRAGVVATIEESKPLWLLPLPQPFVVLGGAIVLLPAMPLGFAGLPRLRRHWLTWLYAASAALMLMQLRFGLVFALPYALAWAAVLTLQAKRGRRTLCALAAAGMLLLLPPLWQADPWSPHEESTWRMLVWMRDHLPPPPSQGPRCLLGPWDVGHKVLHVTGQPVIANNFTELREREAIRDVTAVLLAADFAQVEPILQRRQVRWVWTVATAWPVLVDLAAEIDAPPPTLERALGYLGTRLLLDAGTAVAGPTGARPGTGTLRRIHLSPLELPALWRGQVRGPLREVALFERVAGARLVGVGEPGRPVRAAITVKHPGAAAFGFVQIGTVDASGHFALQVPYATAGMPFGLVAEGLWRVEVDGQAREVAVAERDVAAGLAVAVPSR